MVRQNKALWNGAVEQSTTNKVWLWQEAPQGMLRSYMKYCKTRLALLHDALQDAVALNIFKRAA